METGSIIRCIIHATGYLPMSFTIFKDRRYRKGKTGEIRTKGQQFSKDKGWENYMPVESGLGKRQTIGKGK